MTKMTDAITKIETEANSTELLERLIQMAPYRVVLKKTDDGKYLGLCENSFSMSWETNRVLIFWSGPAYSNLGTQHNLDAISWAKHQAKDKDDLIFDPFSPDCPIEIDWNRWLTATRKYDQRNAHFTTI